jgi:tRNA modification GTPase
MIEVAVALEGIPFVFTDTAGLRDATDDVIEAMGIERTRAAMAIADMLLWLGDEGGGPVHPHRIEVEPKSDDPGHIKKGSAAFSVSALKGEGMNALVSHIVDRAKSLLPRPDQFAVNQRQRALLSDCASALADASHAQDWLIVAEHLRQARLALDALTGRAHTEDMLDMLFGRFCVGK